MSNFYIMLLNFGLGFLEKFLDALAKSNAPSEVIEAFKAAFVALERHRDDEVTKANLEAQRG